MSKSYSTKALPSGTVLREWRLEEVLGVGGFGIVYRGRGLYFDELVAIKEYFPSSISERNDEDTVVPIDSDAEEVHALGLKKFVEEAKLLWNLSTPTRHPNIVSVRSLFEIHGTAYMVMDFEDGLSLSKLLKQGRRFNEVSLKALIRPIAEGLERAHRVGVLHRDIKPPNILVNDDGRPVLIDFGSARFESGDATSTKVTFHTPPYAAIEQYVKTFPQGPWTDIYALGVVLYECVTGEKPPEVLERMHGGLGVKLSDGHWPGYSRPFLAAIDAAMAIKPESRPQSISAWLELFDVPADQLPPPPPEADDDEATRVVPFQAKPDEIVPVAPPLAGFDKSKVATAVPDDASEVSFRGAGQTTGAAKLKSAVESPPAATEAEAGDTIGEPPIDPPVEAPVAAPVGAAPPKQPKTAGKEKTPPPAMPGEAKAKPAPGTPKEKSKRGGLIAAGVAGAVVLAGIGYMALKPGSESSEAVGESDMPAQEFAPVAINNVSGLVTEMQSLLSDATNAKAPVAAVQALTVATEQLGQMQSQFDAAAPGQPQQAVSDQMYAQAKGAVASFVGALVSDADGRAGRLYRDVPWVDPRKPGTLAKQPAASQRIAKSLHEARQALAAAATAAGEAPGPGEAMAAARQGMAALQAWGAAASRAYANRTTEEKVKETTAAVSATTSATETASRTPETTTAAAPQGEVAGSADKLFPAKYRTFNSILSAARADAQSIDRMAKGKRPGSDASDAEKQGYEVRKDAAKKAQGYEKYLSTLANSMRGVRTEREVDQLIASARQTQGYLTYLVQKVSATQ